PPRSLAIFSEFLSFQISPDYSGTCGPFQGYPDAWSPLHGDGSRVFGLKSLPGFNLVSYQGLFPDKSHFTGKFQKIACF
ncbi:MAG: hypothetical protein ACE37M_17285, partial [Henriciella sp.]